MRIFISYGRDEHAALAKRLKEDLQRRGHQVWYDADRLQPGDDWETRIEEALAYTRQAQDGGRVILLMTPHSVRRPDGFCLNEIARAVAWRLMVVPVMLVWCEPPLSICRVQWLDMRDCVPFSERQERYEAKFKRLVEALEQGHLDFGGAQSRLASLLQPLPFDADILHHLPRFTGRQWLFDQIDSWLASRKASRVFWLIARPGMGKTALAAWLCANRREIAAIHLCRHGDRQKADPRRCVLSIAHQLSTQLPEYEARLNALNLEQIIPESNAQTLFDSLIVQPLSSGVSPRKRAVVVVIDALDEATRDDRNELADLIASEFHKTPDWLRLIITSRPEVEVTCPLQGLTPYTLNASTRDNKQDIRRFLRRELRAVASGGRVPSAAVETILTRSEGIFLYVERVRQELIDGRLSLDSLEEFPQGMGGIYAQFFQRQFPDLAVYEDRIRPTLELLAAAQQPLQLTAISAILNWDAYSEARFINSVGSLFVVADAKIQPFHRSVMEWLTDGQQRRAGRYYVSEREGHRRLADYGWQQYESGVATMTPYLLSHLPIHLAAAERWGQIERFLADQAVIRARCALNMVYDVGRDLKMLARLNRPLDRVAQALTEVFKDNLYERLRQQLRSALIQFFGLYEEWPEALRRELEQSNDLPLVLFLGDTHDMEERFDQAEAVFRRFAATTSPNDPVPFATACARLAYILEHEDRMHEALEWTDRFNAEQDMATRCDPVYYWWVNFQRSVSLRRLYRYDEATDLLEKTRSSGAHTGQNLSALHNLGVIDLELGRLPQAETKFQQCLKERGEERWDHRRAFEHRRLGEVYALTGRANEARAAFEQALLISDNCGNRRYTRHVRSDIVLFLDVPARLEKLRSKTLSLGKLARRFGVNPSLLGSAFRVLWQRGQGYLPEVSRQTGEPTGKAVRWDVAHREGYWHATAMVLIVDSDGDVALQERGESDSRGRLDVSVAGHLEIGESDVLCAIRETAEEVGLVTSPTKLVRLGKPFVLFKDGGPNFESDRHENQYLYRYVTNKVNRERTSLFMLRVTDRAQLHPNPDSDGAARIIWHPLMDAVGEAKEHPERFASAFKQLLHPDMLEEIQKAIRQGPSQAGSGNAVALYADGIRAG